MTTFCLFQSSVFEKFHPYITRRRGRADSRDLVGPEVGAESFDRITITIPLYNSHGTIRVGRAKYAICLLHVRTCGVGAHPPN